MKKIGIIILAFSILFLVIGCSKQVSEIVLDKNALTIENGESFFLTAAVLPNNAVDKSVAWSVDSGNVLAVSSENTEYKEFAASKVGTAIISVISSNGLKAACQVTVTENAEERASREEEENRRKEEKAAKEKADEEARIVAAEIQAKEDAKSLAKGDVNISLANDLPATITYYFMGVRSSSCKITKIYLEKDRIGWYDVFIEGTKTFDDNGNNGKTPCRIDWTIYNENGVAVDSFNVGSPQVNVGESFIAERPAAIKDLPPGNYTLKLSDYRVGE